MLVGVGKGRERNNRKVEEVHEGNLGYRSTRTRGSYVRSSCFALSRVHERTLRQWSRGCQINFSGVSFLKPKKNFCCWSTVPFSVVTCYASSMTGMAGTDAVSCPVLPRTLYGVFFLSYGVKRSFCLRFRGVRLNVQVSCWECLIGYIELFSKSWFLMRRLKRWSQW